MKHLYLIACLKPLLNAWLSKYGFACNSTDHDGINFIAHNPYTQERLGLLVKSCWRKQGREQEPVEILLSEIENARRACSETDCTPYISLAIDTQDIIRIFTTSLTHLQEMFPSGEIRSCWQMTDRYLAEYEQDPEIYSFELPTTTRH